MGPKWGPNGAQMGPIWNAARELYLLYHGTYNFLRTITIDVAPGIMVLISYDLAKSSIVLLCCWTKGLWPDSCLQGHTQSE